MSVLRSEAKAKNNNGALAHQSKSDYLTLYKRTQKERILKQWFEAVSGLKASKYDAQSSI